MVTPAQSAKLLNKKKQLKKKLIKTEDAITRAELNRQIQAIDRQLSGI